MNRLHKILFIDIETVPQTKKLEELSDEMQGLWGEKYDFLKRKMPAKYPDEMTSARGYEISAGIYSEFGKIICISVGFIPKSKAFSSFRIKSIAGKDEKQLLIEFSALVKRFFTTDEHNFCGHNIKEFDIPYICRRMLINDLKLPKALQINAKKPWEVNIMDTLDFWKFGDYKNYTSLKLLTAVLGIPTPKDDIDGSQVAEVFYQNDDLPRIVSYCQKDVLATAQVWLKMNGHPLIDTENVKYV